MNAVFHKNYGILHYAICKKMATASVASKKSEARNNIAGFTFCSLLIILLLFDAYFFTKYFAFGCFYL
jgi:hypothetical protein